MPSHSIPRVYNSGMIFLSLNNTIFDTEWICGAFADRNFIDSICPLCHLDYKPGKQSRNLCQLLCVDDAFPAALISGTVHHLPAALLSEIKLQVPHTDLFFPDLDSDNSFLIINMSCILISIAEAMILHKGGVEKLFSLLLK